MGFFDSCWPFGQQLYKLDIAKVLKSAKEAEAAAKEAAETAEAALTGTVKSVNGHDPDVNGNAVIPGFQIYQRCAQQFDTKGIWNGVDFKDFEINMGFKEIIQNQEIGQMLRSFPAWLAGTYTIHGLPFTTSFAYAFADPIAASQDVFIVEPSTGKLYKFYLDGAAGKVISSTIGESGGGESGGGESGGGGYRLIRKIVVDETNQANGYIITTDEDGNPFALKHIYIVADLTIGSYRSDGALRINDIAVPWVFGTVTDAEYYDYFQADVVGEDYMLTRYIRRLPIENPKQGENTGLKKLTGSITDIRFKTASQDAFYGIGTTFEIYGY